MKEKPKIPCLWNPEAVCDCEHLAENVKSLNEFGNRNRSIRARMQREGYDRVSPALIRELLMNPHGGFFTTAFNEVVTFGGGMWAIRYQLGLWRLDLLMTLESEHGNVKCNALRTFLETTGVDKGGYLKYLREREWYTIDTKNEGPKDKSVRRR